jgi:tyrosine-protein kinase Etk/Wzc
MPESTINPETQAAPDELRPVDGEEISLLDLAIVLAKHKKLILGLPLVAAIVAAVISLLLQNIYTSASKILPPQQNQSSTAAAILGQLGGVAGLVGTALPGLKNPSDLYVGVLRSRTIADNIIARFNLKTLYEENSTDDTRKVLDKNTTVVSGKDGLITIEFEDKDPKRAAAIANAYVEELDRLTQVLALTEASQRRLFFEKQLKVARDSLSEAEMALKITQESTGLIKLDDQGKAIIEAVSRLRAEVASKEVQLAAMRIFATEKNPEYVLVQQQIAGLRTQLAKLEGTNVVGQGDIFVPTGKVPEAGLEYLRRFRDVKYHETMFEVLAKQYELARIDEAKDAPVIQVVDKAVEPEKKSKPRRALIVLFAALLGGFLAIVVAFIREFIHSAKSRPHDAQRIRMLRTLLSVR